MGIRVDMCNVPNEYDIFIENFNWKYFIRKLYILNILIFYGKRVPEKLDDSNIVF